MAEIQTNNSSEKWIYAGLRDEGKSVEWIDAKGEEMLFKAGKNTKAIAVGSMYLISHVSRDENGIFESAQFGGKQWLEHFTDSELINKWTVKNDVSAQSQMKKRCENKIKKENEEGFMDMTINELFQLSKTMNRSERSILVSLVLRRLQ